MTNHQPTARTAADLPEGTRVTSPEGRTGTVNGYDLGRVTNTEHANYGREYIGVTWDPTDSIPWGERSRPFVDELTIVAADASDEAPFQPGQRVVHADGRRFNFVNVNPEDSARLLVERPTDGRVVSWRLSECRAESETEIAARHGETDKLHRELCGDQPERKTPDLRSLANPKKADPETVAEIHASRCPECKGAGCPQCGYKGTPRTICPKHHVVDKRGGRAVELGTIPACEPITYGAWSEGAGGFVYTGDCATEVANWAADELRRLAKEDDTDTIQILAVCPDHEEQPKNGCEECNPSADEGEGADEAEAPTRFLVDPHTWLRRSY